VSTTEFGLDVGGAGEALRLRVSGEIDLATGPQLQESILAAAQQARRVELDARDVSFLDSSGIAALLAAHQAADVLGCEVVVTSASPHVRKVLRVSGVAAFLGLVDGTGAP
jgi:anti-sigma B factor antagonist